jgi:hypothetical protein
MNIGKKVLLLHKEEDSWSPANLSGLALWLDANDLATLYTDSGKTTPVSGDGDVVGCWADKSGNGKDAIQATTSKKPTYKTGIKNGLPALLFEPTGKGLYIDPYTTTQPFHIVTVSQFDANYINDDCYSMILSGYAGPPYYGINAGLNPDRWTLYFGKYLNGGVSDSNWNVMVGLINGLNGELRMNGVSIATGEVRTNEFEEIYIGHVSTNHYWKGYITEILIYDPSLAADDLALLETYLMAKWGIS